MWWILLVLVPALLSVFGCADNRPVEHQQKKKKPEPTASKSTRSTKSTKSTKSTTSKRRRKRRRKGKSIRSSKIGQSGKESTKSGRSSKKSTKSGKKSEKKSGKKDESTKTAKSSKSSRSSKSKPSCSSKSLKSRKSRKPKEVEIKSVKPAILSKEEIVEPIVKPSAEAVVPAPLVKSPPAIVDVPVPEPTQTPCVTERNCVKIRADPAEMNFKPTGGLKEFKIVNDSDEKRVFKIKCTDNQLYRVSPVVGQIDPHQTVVVDILRQNGSIKVDKLVLVTAKAKENGKGGNFWGCQKTVVPLLVDV